MKNMRRRALIAALVAGSMGGGALGATVINAASSSAVTTTTATSGNEAAANAHPGAPPNGGAPNGVFQFSKKGFSVVVMLPDMMLSLACSMSASPPQKANGPRGRAGGRVTRSASPLPALPSGTSAVKRHSGGWGHGRSRGNCPDVDGVPGG